MLKYMFCDQKRDLNFCNGYLVCCIFARSCRKFLLQLGWGFCLDWLLSKFCNVIHINYKTDFNSCREISIEIFNKFEISGPCLFSLFNSNYGCRIAYQNAPNDNWFISKSKSVQKYLNLWIRRLCLKIFFNKAALLLEAMFFIVIFTYLKQISRPKMAKEYRNLLL